MIALVPMCLVIVGLRGGFSCSGLSVGEPV
jgi:hypothetical protein